MARSVGVVAAPEPPGDGEDELADFARLLWWERRVRTRFIPEAAFGEPGWDLILDVYAASARGTPLRLNRAHLSACVSPSIAERRARDLAAIGILELQPTRAGSRRLEMNLTSLTHDRLENYLNEIRTRRFPRAQFDPRRSLAVAERQLSERGACEAAALVREALRALQSFEETRATEILRGSGD